MDDDYLDDEADEGDRFSDAIRILLLVAAVAAPLDDKDQATAPVGAVAVLKAESRLQKLDFWLRNPDYLADELLNDYERSREAILLDIAGDILDSDEPEVCAIPMLRYLFGAFEALDRALSVLVAPRLLIITQQRRNQRVLQDNYFLTEKGRQLAQQATEQYPELAWYTQRALLVQALAEATGHSALALRRRQYLQRDYAETPLNEIIPSIAARTRARLAGLRSAQPLGDAA
ncbi:hypothetical protein AB0N79_36440 [Streptomyces microflavus]|uniref:hypothetical protein n=1 Tax=Streptomyces microflavus TaxID=1919 RepID=UPI003448505B